MNALLPCGVEEAMQSARTTWAMNSSAWLPLRRVTLYMKRYAALIAPLSIRILTIGISEDVDVPRTARVLRSTCQMRKARRAICLLQLFYSLF